MLRTIAAAGAVVGLVAPQLLLGAFGFGSKGIVASTTAAKWMSGIALSNGVGVAANSTYALLQSAGAAGVPAAVSAAGAAVSGAIAAGMQA